VRARIHIAVLVLFTLTSSSCIHRVDNRQPSPYEKAVTYSAMLAATNDSIADALIAANRSGLISVADTDRILHFQSQIADDHQRLSSILNSGTSGAKDSADAINKLLADIDAQANAMIVGGGLWIKNARSQQTIGDDVHAILSFGPLITTNLRLAGVLQ
jgi:hypothetical protein